jgi:hypothetical protein
VFVLATTFQSILTIAGNTRSLPKKEASERCSNWVGSETCPQILRPDWKGFPRTNTIFLALIVSDEGKKFYNIDSR